MAVSDVNTAIMVLQQMLPGPSFSVLLDPLVTTTSTNEFLVVAAATTQGTRKRRGSPPVRSEDYFESVVPRYSDPTFKFHFRMCRSTFEDLLCKLEPTLCCKIQPAGKKILCFLWLMGNRESFRSVADRFGISKSSLHRNLTHVANSLLILSKEEIQWPKETFEKKAISKEFEKFPGVVGCVDGTYIPMTGKSGAKRDLYICRKGFPAMHAQVVCDGNLTILDIITGYPGSVNDASVFQNSALYQALQSLPMQYHLLGDSAYTLEHFLMTPYKDNGSLNDTQKIYNFMHSSVRCCVERCIGLLKGKFRRLKNYECRGDELMCKTIIGCATLHNFILKREQVDEADIDLSDVESEKVDLSFVYSAAPNSRASKKRDDLSKKLI